MNDKVNKVFEILGIKPDEPFQITDLNLEPTTPLMFRLTPRLDVLYKDSENSLWERSEVWSLKNLLISNNIKLHRIKPPIKPTEADKAIIAYAKTLGTKWIAQDKNGDVYAYTHKPIKSISYPRRTNDIWRVPEKHSDRANTRSYRLHKNLSFISWEDDEPYYIGDEENE